MSSALNIPPVAVVTDSTSGLLGAPLPALDAVHIVPLIVQRDGKDFRENVDITGAEVLQALEAGEVLTTSRPAPAEFSRVYEELAESGVEAAVSIHLSSDLSGTYEAAVTAAKDAPIPVEVVDSKTAGMVLGFGAYAAASAVRATDRRSDAVETASNAAQVARDVMSEGNVLFYVDTLEYLHRGGRVGSVSALLGTALSVKPLLAVVDGHIELSEKVRTRRRALERLVARCATSGKKILENFPQVDVSIQHLGAPRAADEALRQIRKELGSQVRHGVVTGAGAVLGTHVGPGVVGAIVTPVIHSHTS